MRLLRSAAARLDRPLSAWWCVVGWLTSALVFAGFLQLAGGSTSDDAAASAIASWAIAQGQLCWLSWPAWLPPARRIAHRVRSSPRPNHWGSLKRSPTTPMGAA
jgi:hypothetical protein